MDRLTMWYDGNHAICENEECTSGDCPFADPICEQVQNIIDRLAAYEDTGFEPEEIGALKSREKGLVELLSGVSCGCAVTYTRLRELVQADREGRVHIEEKTYQCPKCGAYRLTPRLDKQFYFCFNCKTQFACAEAEAALEGMKNG